MRPTDGPHRTHSTHRRALFRSIAALGVAGAVAAAHPAAARAQDAGGRAALASGPALDARLTVDGAIIATALALAGVASRAHVDTEARWGHELLPFDDPVKQNFSAAAARTSDLLLTLAVLTPLAFDAGRGLDADMGRRTLVYGETIAVSLALNTAAKYLVGRPRPYVYNSDPLVEEYTRRQDQESRLSFYSGHAATSFAAAVAGAYLFTQSSTDTTARAAVWATGLALAGATTNLRVRGGKHFYSDVLIGAAVGAGVGLAVPMLHYRDQPGMHALSTPEWVAIAVAPLAGALIAQLVPMPSDITVPLGAAERTARATQTSPPAQLVPWFSGTGGGVMLARRF